MGFSKIPQERIQSESVGRTASVVTALLLFFCVISVAFYAYQKSLDPSISIKDVLQKFQVTGNNAAKEAKVQYSFDFDSGEKPVFAIFGDYLVKSSSNGIWFLDKKGGVVRSESIAFNNPMIKTNGSQLLAADIGTGEIWVFVDKTVRWRDKLDSSIMNADISVDGYVTVITASKRDNNEVRVYEPHGVELFRKIIANDFAISAGVAPSKNMLAVSVISTGVAGAYSNYKFYDLEGNALAEQAFDISGDMLPIFWYNNDGSLFAAGDRALASLDKAGKVIWEKQFKSVAGAARAGNKRLVAVIENNESRRVVLYNTAGQELSSASLQGKPRGLAAIKGAIAVNTYDTVYFYNEKCKKISTYSAGSQIRQVHLYDKQQAAVITDNKITIINIM